MDNEDLFKTSEPNLFREIGNGMNTSFLSEEKTIERIWPVVEGLSLNLMKENENGD